MLGHASITLTVDTYGKWLPMGNKAAVDRLDETPFRQSGGKMVAGTTKALRRRPQVVDVTGDPGRARTFNPEIKSRLPALIMASLTVTQPHACWRFR